jgi:DNA-binding response OmpR family regulator
VTSRRRETILVIEDDESIRSGLELNLRVEGYRVIGTDRMATGMKLVRQELPDLILLDLMLPDGSGLDLLKSLRRDNPEMPVLILTARGMEVDKVQGLSLGADDYITKPFGLAELLARIDAALRRKRMSDQGSKISIAGIEIDEQRRQVNCRGEPVQLTAKEFDLLLYMARRPERVFSREQLLEEVWGHDYVGTDRTVDNFIRALRSKLEQDPGRPRHLLTVHGVGYRLQKKTTS